MGIISNINLGDWNYYIFADDPAIWSILNGIAAWTNGQGGLLRQAALLGGLILLAMALFKVAVGDRAGLGAMGAWFVIVSSIGMTANAVVWNMYSGKMYKVDNVPALAIIPAALFSTAGYEIFKTTETALQTASGSYMSVSESGFMGPLDILLSLRGMAVPSEVALLRQSTNKVIQDCATNPESVPTGASESVGKSRDLLKWLAENGSKIGLTEVYSVAGELGEIMTCESAFNYLNSEFEDIAAGGNVLTDLVNANTRHPAPARAGDVGDGSTTPSATATNGKRQPSEVADSYQKLMGNITGMQQTAVQFTKNALVAETARLAYRCMNASGSITAPSDCEISALATSEGLDKWKVASAGESQGFLKIMFSSIGVMQSLFFALFPFIIVYCLAMPMKAAPVVGGYVLLGIWSQTWVIVVAPIQSYIQISVMEELRRVGGSLGGLAMDNASAVYDVLSTRLGVASDMMAGAQTLSLALLSGSIYALTSFAAKTEVGESASKNLSSNTGGAPAFTQADAISKQKTLVGADGKVSIAGQTAGSADFELSTTNSNIAAQQANFEKTHAKTIQTGRKIAAQVEEATGYKMTEAEQFSYGQAVSERQGFNGEVNSKIAGSVINSLANKGNKQAKESIAKARVPGARGVSGAMQVASENQQRSEEAHKADKSLEDSGRTGVSEVDSIDTSIQTATKEGRGYSAQRQTANSSKIVLNTDAIRQMAIDNPSIGQHAAATAAAMRTGSKGTYKAEAIAAADQRVDAIMAGRRFSNDAERNLVRNLAFQNELGGSVDIPYQDTTGVSSGANVSTQSYNPEGHTATGSAMSLAGADPNHVPQANPNSAAFKRISQLNLAHARESAQKMLADAGTAQARLESTEEGRQAMAAFEGMSAENKKLIAVAAASGMAEDIAGLIPGPAGKILSIAAGMGAAYFTSKALSDEDESKKPAAFPPPQSERGQD